MCESYAGVGAVRARSSCTTLLGRREEIHRFVDRDVTTASLSSPVALGGAGTSNVYAVARHGRSNGLALVMELDRGGVHVTLERLLDTVL